MQFDTNPDNDSTETEHQTDPQVPDTASDEFESAIANASHGEPFAVDIALRAIVLRRVDFERELGESFADWIRSAVDQRLASITDGAVDPFEGVERGRPSDYTATHDMPDDDVVAAVEEANAGDWVGVTVEFPAGVLLAVADECDDDEEIVDWIRRAVEWRFNAIDNDIELTPAVRVDVPDEIAQRARLKADHLAIEKPDTTYQEELRDALLEYVQAQAEYVVSGEVIASFADPDVSDPDSTDE